MNWINTLTAWQWLILGLVPPLIFLLYFLKLRRKPLEVPSTYLWTKSVEDLHVNSIWQRLRKNLLLLLQILAVLMLMMACLRPGCQGEKLVGDRFIFVVDHSASMSATDLEKGKTRLEEAKEQIRILIERMQPSDAGMIISFSDRAEVQQSYTTNRTLLRRKLASIRQTQRTSDLNEALLAASGLANPGRTSDRNSNIDVQVAEALDATLFLFTDGGVKSIPSFSLGNLTPEYRPIGAIDPPENVGITAFSLNDQMSGGEQVQVFARLQNSGLEERKIDVSLFVKDQLQDARGSVTIPGLGSTSLQFDLTGLASDLEEPISVRLEIDDDDVFLADNIAHCILTPPRRARVLVISDYDRYFAFAMKTDRVNTIADVQFENREFLESETYRERATLGLYDLVIYDQCAPDKMPLCNTVLWGAVPKSETWNQLEELEVAPIVDFESSHPLLFAVPLGNVNILFSDTIEGPQGSISLVDSVGGSIMKLGPRGSFQDLVIGFALVRYENSGDISINSDWPKKLSFPLFMQNLITRLGGGNAFNMSRSISPGATIRLNTDFPTDSIEVRTPDGQRISVDARNDGTFVFSQTDHIGVYEVRESGGAKIGQLFAVNLLDRTESNLAVRDALELGYNEVTGKRTTIPAREDYWMWLVLTSLGLITLEWIIYNRRVFI